MSQSRILPAKEKNRFAVNRKNTHKKPNQKKTGQPLKIPLTKELRDTNPYCLQTAKVQGTSKKQKITWITISPKQTMNTMIAIHLSL